MALEWSADGPYQDIDRLYRRLSGRLEHIVRGDVHAPEPLIEDACQVAWGRLLDHSDRVRRDTAFAWLVATAIHEAFRLLRRARLEVPFDSLVEAEGESPLAVRSPGPYERVAQRERLAALADLPVRRQRLVWLRALGLSYDEMASYERCTVRTIERQLAQAKGELRMAGR